MTLEAASRRLCILLLTLAPSASLQAYAAPVLQIAQARPNEGIPGGVEHLPGGLAASPISPPTMNPPPAVLAPAPSLEPTPPMAAPPAAVIVPGCPGRADCPPQPETEGPFSEAAKEIIKEFVKCEAEGKSLDQCLLDDPPPPTLSSLDDDERTQLTGCLGSQDLSATRDFWEQCVARLR